MEQNLSPPTLVQRAKRKVTQGASATIYRLNQLRHRRKLPALSPLASQIVKEVEQDGVSVVPIKKLAFSSNAAFLEAAARALDDASAFSTEIEYDAGFEHCIPINPSKIATDYPPLFLWGLDELLLDIIENCIGLPIAYHGVIVRKEIVDGRKVATRMWHKDNEDRNIIRVSVYLNDVLDAESGPFEYIPKNSSPSYRDFPGLDSISNEDMERVVPSSKWRTCTGPAGTVIIGAVGQVFHHGKLPANERVAASFYYTSRNPTDEELCWRFSFQKGIPHIDVPLTQRQRDCLWKYEELLP